MKVRNIVRKAAVLGSSAALVGTTLMGALAYDLGTYPAKFIVDGQFDGKIVVGENAATADVLGAIDIAASLQAASVKKVTIPGAAGEVSLEGDTYKISTSADQVELREFISEVVDTITEDDLTGLKSGRLTTSEGTTGYAQYIRLQDVGTLQNISVNFIKNDGEKVEKMSDYMIVDTQLPFLQWEIQFDEGFESELDGTDLDDFEDRSFNIMGTDYSIVSASVNTSGIQNFQMELMGGSVADTLREGETRAFSINGVDYEVTLVFVSDPSTSGGENEAKFSVNGELTQAMAESDTDTLSGGLQIGVRDVLVNSREGVASFYLGAQKITVTDPLVNNTDFDGDIEVNDDVSESNVLDVAGSLSGTTFEITSIKYQVTMESEDGSGGVAYIPPGHGVRELMEEPELLLSDVLDLRYEGLTKPQVKEAKFYSSGDDEYKLSFTNIDGKEYKGVPILSTDSGATDVLAFGDQDDDLVFVEGTAGTFFIGIDDYLIVSSKSGADDHKAVTNVLRYDEYDADQRTLSFTDLAGGTVSTVVDTLGNGTIKVGGHSYTVGVSAPMTVDDGNIFVDLDGDGSVTAGEYAVVTTWGGLVVNLLANTTNTSATLGNGVTRQTLVGNGLSFPAPGAGWYVNMTATVDTSLFDTAGDETFAWAIEENAGETELDLNFADNSYSGPLDNSAFDPVSIFEFDELEDDSEKTVGMTDYGILITELNPDDADDQNTLTLEVPEEQRLAQVFVTLGSVTPTEGGAGSSDQINPIAVGLAVLDSNAAGLLGSENLIVVGGPCANTVAAELLGNPADCTEGFELGKAAIRAWDQGTSVAILVAGYSAQDTQGASKVLAAYKDYSGKLSGSEVEVVVADLNSISVTPMS